MKTFLLTLAIGSIAVLAQAKEEAKDVTATGEVVCAHCDLEIGAKGCQQAIKTKKGKIYLLAGDKVKAFFKANEDVAKVTATGKPSKKLGVTELAVSKISKPAKKS